MAGVEDGGRFAIVASYAGSPRHPAWFLNLEANPEVQLQVRSRRFSGTARRASAEEKAQLWPRLIGIYPAYADYQKRTSAADETQQAMLKRLELPATAYSSLMARARDRGIDFLSTPFDLGSLEFLMSELRLPRIKVGSGDMTNAPLLLKVAQAGREVILSTGMATLAEVEEALSVLAFGYARRSSRPSRRAWSGWTWLHA